MVNLKRIGEASATLGLTKKEFEALVEKGKITYELSKGKQRLFDVDKYLGTLSPEETKGPKTLKRSPYWEQDNVEESKKLLKALGLELPTLDPKNKKSPNYSKPVRVSWDENGIITTPLENKPKVSEGKLWGKLLNAHLKRWGKIDVGNLGYKSKMTRIYIEKDKEKIMKFRKLFDDARLCYNVTTDYLRGETTTKDQLQIRNIFVTQIRENTEDRERKLRIRDEAFLKAERGCRKKSKNVEDLERRILATMGKTPKDIRANSCFEAVIAHNNFIQKTGHTNPDYILMKEKISEDPKNNELKESLKTIPYKVSKIPSNLKHRRSRDRFAHIIIPKTEVRQNGNVLTMYPTFDLGEIKTLKPLGPITADFKIRWDRHLNIYHIITAEPIDSSFKKTKKGFKTKASTKDPRVVPKDRNLRVTCFDPGLRTIATAVNSDGEIKEYGKEWYLNPKIEKKLKRLARLASLEKTAKIPLRGLRGRERYNVWAARKQAVLVRCKLRNMIDDLHKKLANKIINSNDVIIFPKLTAKGKNLPQNIKDLLKLLAHCRFHNYLAWKAATKGKFVIDQNESYTTKTCYSCGYLTEVGGNKVYTCSNEKCGVVCDRDVNACFNILTRYMSSLSSQDPWVPPRTHTKGKSPVSPIGLVTHVEVLIAPTSG